MTQSEAIKTLRQNIKHLAVAAACDQINMQAMKRGRAARGLCREDEPLFMLDRLAEQLAEPALRALAVIEQSSCATPMQHPR